MVGSQLVGLVPLKALLDVASFYCEKENLFVLEEEQRMRLVGWAAAGRAGRGGKRSRRSRTEPEVAPRAWAVFGPGLPLQLCFVACTEK